MAGRKVRVGRIFLLIITVIALGVLTAFAFSRIVFRRNDPPAPVNPVNPVNPDKPDDGKKDTLKIDLVNYEVYFNDVTDFVIAEIRFRDEKKIDFDLKNLNTSDKINLGDYAVYKRKLEEKGYYLSKLNVVYEVSSQDNSYTCKLFVPFTTKDTKLTLFNEDKKICDFNLTVNQKEIENLKYETGTEISDKDNYVIYVSNAYKDDMVKYNGEAYSSGSSTKIFVYELDIREIKDGVKLEKAEFVTSDKEVYEALGSEYTSSKIVNMFASEVKKGQRYGIFVEVFSPDASPVSYDGTLRLKFSSSEDWIELSTKLN